MNVQVSSSLDTLLLEAFHAYRAGLLRQKAGPSPPRVLDFDALKFLGTVGLLSPSERLDLRKLHSQCGRGLSLAREGRIEESHARYMKALESLARLGNGARLAHNLGVSTYRAGIAYLDFRRGQLDSARENLVCAMEADVELEDAGLSVMQMHRVQQGHNLARMELRLGTRMAAVKLAGLLLAYMERQVMSLPFHRSWNPKVLREVPLALVRAMIHQVVGETATYIVTGQGSGSEWRELIGAAALRLDPESAVYPQVQFALRAQRCRLLDDAEGFLRNLGLFFRFGIRDCHLLWYSVLVELTRFCDEMGTALALQIERQLARDSAKWRAVPPGLGAHFGNLRTQVCHPPQESVGGGLLSHEQGQDTC